MYQPSSLTCFGCSNNWAFLVCFLTVILGREEFKDLLKFPWSGFWRSPNFILKTSCLGLLMVTFWGLVLKASEPSRLEETFSCFWSLRCCSSIKSSELGLLDDGLTISLTFLSVVKRLLSLSELCVPLFWISVTFSTPSWLLAPFTNVSHWDIPLLPSWLSRPYMPLNIPNAKPSVSFAISIFRSVALDAAVNFRANSGKWDRSFLMLGYGIYQELSFISNWDGDLNDFSVRRTAASASHFAPLMVLHFQFSLEDFFQECTSHSSHALTYHNIKYSLMSIAMCRCTILSTVISLNLRLTTYLVIRLIWQQSYKGTGPSCIFSTVYLLYSQFLDIASAHNLQHVGQIIWLSPHRILAIVMKLFVLTSQSLADHDRVLDATWNLLNELGRNLVCIKVFWMPRTRFHIPICKSELSYTVSLVFQAFYLQKTIRL